jgi:stringent starvation protein B
MTSNRPYLVRAIFDWICDNHLTPFVVARADAEGLKVPPSAIDDGRVVLNLGPSAVTRFEMGPQEISFLARFSGVSHYIVVPIAAVVALYARENGQGMMFPDDLPVPIGDAEAVDELAPQEMSPPVPEDPTPPKRGGHLKVVK